MPRRLFLGILGLASEAAQACQDLASHPRTQLTAAEMLAPAGTCLFANHNFAKATGHHRTIGHRTTGASELKFRVKTEPLSDLRPHNKSIFQAVGNVAGSPWAAKGCCRA